MASNKVSVYWEHDCIYMSQMSLCSNGALCSVTSEMYECDGTGGALYSSDARNG